MILGINISKIHHHAKSEINRKILKCLIIKERCTDEPIQILEKLWFSN